MVNLKIQGSSTEDSNGESTSTWSSSKPTRASSLGRAHEELFRRSPDERFSSLAELDEHCRQEKQFSTDTWQLPQTLRPRLLNGELSIALESDADGQFNDWSFSQMCRMSGVSRDTLNRLSADTASRVFGETLPSTNKPVQLLTTGRTVRSIHGVSYTRLWNSDLLDVVREFGTDFQPPQTASNGGTGLYCGEQDMFCFLIDPTGWAEIDGEAFAPGFFVWNSEVGRRSLGIQTFWFQAVCQNHIVWDAVEVVEFTRKHTANVRDGLNEIRQIIDRLVAQRDSRRDSFVSVIRNAMRSRLGSDADEAAKTLLENGIPRNLCRKALEIAQQQGAFTIFSIVDALTRLSQQTRFAGDRVEMDSRIGNLLKLAV